MRLLDFLTESTNNTDVDKITAHWVEQHVVSSGDLRDGVADDLEQLEYSPKEIDKLVPIIVAKVNTAKSKK